MRFLKLSEKRADENFRVGKTLGYAIMVQGTNVLTNDFATRRNAEQRFNAYAGLKSDVRKFLRSSGTFSWILRHTNEGVFVEITFAREDPAMMFKLTFA